MPCSPIVAPMLAICSGVARSLSWPIALEPTARSSRSALAAGIVLGLATGTRGASLKPNASAWATSLFAPSLAPSGAKTELHEFANDAARLPPHDSLLALARRTPESVADVCAGKLLDALAIPLASTPDSVTILKVEPGG